MLASKTFQSASAQGYISSMERLLEVNAIPDAKPTTHNSVVVRGGTQSMQQKCLLSFKLNRVKLNKNELC